jgi:hypothetical protein
VSAEGRAAREEYEDIADCGKRVLLSHLFDFVFSDFQVQRFKHSTQMSMMIKVARIIVFITNRFKHTSDTNTRVNLCLSVYHTP